MFMEDREACCFLHIVVGLMSNDNEYYILPVKGYKDIQGGKQLLGFYDDNYYYIFPGLLTKTANGIASSHGLKDFNIKHVLEIFFAANLIKTHWILTDKVRYRPQKRIGKTRRRYITFIRDELDKIITLMEEY